MLRLRLHGEGRRRGTLMVRSSDALAKVLVSCQCGAMIRGARHGKLAKAAAKASVAGLERGGAPLG